MPETIDDWTEVLTAFKEQKGATAPLTGVGLPQSFVGAFDVGYNWYIEGGQVQYGPLQSGYKEYLQTLNQWYESGLMDRDMASNQRDAGGCKITDGNRRCAFFKLYRQLYGEISDADGDRGSYL